MSTPRFSNYQDFFAFYLSEHSHPRNRVMHAAGTLLGILTIVAAIAFRHPWYALLWPVVAYGFAWVGHFVIEGNRPATFDHPVWSFMGDFHMLSLMLTGRLRARLEKDAQKEAA